MCFVNIFTTFKTFFDEEAKETYKEKKRTTNVITFKNAL